MKTPPPEKVTEDTKEMFQNIANYGGGPAHPQQMQWGMTDGVPNVWFAVGMTKRERFAMAAMQGIVSGGDVFPFSPGDRDKLVEEAVNCADALLERLKK